MRKIIGTFCFVLAFMVFVLFLKNTFTIYNYTGSEPIGVYGLTGKMQFGFDHYVVVCLEGVAEKEAIFRGLGTSGGLCPDHVTPLLKAFYSNNQLILFTAKGFYRDGIEDSQHLIPNTAPLPRDSNGESSSTLSLR